MGTRTDNEIFEEERKWQEHADKMSYGEAADLLENGDWEFSGRNCDEELTMLSQAVKLSISALKAQAQMAGKN